MNVCRHGCEWACEICDPGVTKEIEYLNREAKKDKFDFLADRERKVLKQLAKDKDMSEEAVMRQALRTYQLVDKYVSEGLELAFRHPNGEYTRPMYTGPKMAPMEPNESKS